MLEKLKVNDLTITVEGTWYEVSNGVEVITYGNVESGTTPTQVYELLSADVKADAKTDTYIYLPNKSGAYHSVRVPQYITRTF